MQNIECKAELRDLALARGVCHALGAIKVATLEQVDTYYRVANGRLKRRQTTGEPPEFILYERADALHARASNFSILSEDQARLRFGSVAMPVWIEVRKVRELWLHGAVRIHLDTVEGLGTFIEFESLVTRSNPPELAERAIASLREKLAPAMGEAIDCSYSDMLVRERDA